jgi:hypothetical protein
MLGFGPDRRTGWANPTKQRPSTPARPPSRRGVDPATSPDPQPSSWRKSHLQHFGAGCGPNATAHTPGHAPFPESTGKGRGRRSSGVRRVPPEPSAPPPHPCRPGIRIAASWARWARRHPDPRPAERVAECFWAGRVHVSQGRRSLLPRAGVRGCIVSLWGVLRDS